MRTLTTLLFGLLLIAVAAILTERGASAQVPWQATVRIMNGVPGLQTQDFDFTSTDPHYNNPLLTFADMPFNEMSTYEALSLPSQGTYVTHRHSPDGVWSDLGTFTILNGQVHTFVLIGTTAAQQLMMLDDDNSAPSAGQARLRAVHVSPDAPNIDLYEVGDGVIASDLAYQESSSYLALPAGSPHLQLRLAGSESVLLDLPATTLEAARTYTLFVVGLADGQPPLAANLVTDAVAQVATATPQPNASAAPTATPAVVPPTGGGGSAGTPVAAIGLVALGSSLIAVTTWAVVRTRRPIRRR